LSTPPRDYPQPVRDSIFRLFRPETSSVDAISSINFLLGELFADAALAAIKSTSLTTEQIDLIASHGQTIWHDPIGKNISGRTIQSTFQIGEPSIIAARTGITIVADFRPADMAHGGQGAPLVSYPDWILFGDPNITRTVQNIGGIANVTYLPAGGDIDDVIAFDTGPGNMLIDAAVDRLFGLPFDKNGDIASHGHINESLLSRLMSNPFFDTPPSKSTGRELFGTQFLDDLLKNTNVKAEDIVATLTAFTARTIADQYKRWLPQMPDEVILGGGGAHNRTLWKMLEKKLSPARFRTHEEFRIPGDAKEAIAFAILGSETIRGVPSNVPSATGASKRVVLGKIIPGDNWHSLLWSGQDPIDHQRLSHPSTSSGWQIKWDSR
jgi:anhydro-N-acetylmuramic acid kinase